MNEHVGKQIILEEEFDENYEPAEEEILEYAKFLGMDENEDKHLFWIARESLKAPLPADWKPCQSEDGNIYYFNFSTGESVWDHPCDEHYRQLYEREKSRAAGVTNTIDSRAADGIRKESSSRESSKSPRPQKKNALIKKPTADEELLSGFVSKPALTPIQPKGLAPLQPILSKSHDLKPLSKDFTLEKPSVLGASSLFSTNGARSKLKMEDDFGIEDIDDDDDDDDDQFFSPISKSSPTKTVGALKPIVSAPVIDAEPLKSDSLSDITNNAKSSRAMAVIETTEVESFESLKPSEKRKESVSDEDLDTDIRKNLPNDSKGLSESDNDEFSNFSLPGMENIKKPLVRAQIDSAPVTSTEDEFTGSSRNPSKRKSNPASLQASDDLPKKLSPKQSRGSMSSVNMSLRASLDPIDINLSNTIPKSVPAIALNTTPVKSSSIASNVISPISKPSVASTVSASSPSNLKVLTTFDTSVPLAKPVEGVSVAIAAAIEVAKTPPPGRPPSFTKPHKEVSPTINQNIVSSSGMPSVSTREKNQFDSDFHKTDTEPLANSNATNSLQASPSIFKNNLNAATEGESSNAEIVERKENLKNALDAEWEQYQNEMQQKHNIRINELQIDYKQKLQAFESSENAAFSEKVQNLKHENEKKIEELIATNKKRLTLIDLEYEELEIKARAEMQAKLDGLNTETRLQLEELNSDNSKKFQMLAIDIQNKFKLKIDEFENNEKAKFDALTNEVRQKHEVELQQLKESLSSNREATLASNLAALSEFEQKQYESEKDLIKKKYEKAKIDFELEEKQKLELAAVATDASIKKQIKDVEEECALKNRNRIMSLRSDSESKYAAEKSKIELDNEKRLSQLRLDLESEARKFEIELKHKHSCLLESLKLKSQQEADENERRIHEEHIALIKVLENDYNSRVEDIRSKLFSDGKEEEMQQLLKFENELSIKRQKIEEERKELSNLQRETDNIRNRLLLEKEALLDMERAVTSAISESKRFSRSELENSKKNMDPSSGVFLETGIAPSLDDEISDSASFQNFDTISNKHIDYLIDKSLGIPDKESGIIPEVDTPSTVSGISKIKHQLDLNDEEISRRKKLEANDKSFHEEIDNIIKSLSRKNEEMRSKKSRAPALFSLDHGNHSNSSQLKPSFKAESTISHLIVPLSIHELDCRLSSMLGKARISKQKVEKSKPLHTNNSNCNTQSLSKFATTYRSSIRDNFKTNGFSIDIHGKKHPLVANAWEINHNTTEANLAERKAWLDRFIIEKQLY